MTPHSVAVLLALDPDAQAEALRNTIDCVLIDLAAKRRELQELLDLAAVLRVEVPAWALV